MTRTFTILLLGACLLPASACSKSKVPEEKVAAVAPQKPAPAPKREQPPKPPWEVPPPPIPKNVTPERVPVEEDFVLDAEERIEKNAKLNAELDRIAADIKKSGG